MQPPPPGAPWERAPSGPAPAPGYGAPPLASPPPYTAYGAPVATTDTVRLPLRRLTAGWAVLIVTSLLSLAVTEALLAHGASSALFGVASTIRSLTSAAGEALLVAGAALLAKARRPGHVPALVAAVAYAVSLAFTGVWILVGASGVSVTVFRAFMLAHGVVDMVALGSLVVGLGSLGRSRERRIDVVVVAVLVWLVLSFGLSVVTNVAEVRFPRQLHYVILLVHIGTRVALMASAWRLVSFVPLPDPAMARGSAYRGPMEAWPSPPADEGNLPLGFMAGFFGGCVGAGLVLALAKGPATKRGAAIGFACQAVVGILLRLALSGR